MTTVKTAQDDLPHAYAQGGRAGTSRAVDSASYPRKQRPLAATHAVAPRARPAALSGIAFSHAAAAAASPLWNDSGASRGHRPPRHDRRHTTHTRQPSEVRVCTLLCRPLMMCGRAPPSDGATARHTTRHSCVDGVLGAAGAGGAAAKIYSDGTCFAACRTSARASETAAPLRCRAVRGQLEERGQGAVRGAPQDGRCEQSGHWAVGGPHEGRANCAVMGYGGSWRD